MHSLSVSVDVPDLAEGVRFYTSAFGFSKSAEPVPGVVVLDAGDVQICLLEKREGSQPSSHTAEMRHYERHWTPVHLDIHVDDIGVTLAKALDAGATQEQFIENPEHGSVAFCSDPFGHGFCLIEMRRRVRARRPTRRWS
jgi:predicted enzyme related to lactoylglutathione lyase